MADTGSNKGPLRLKTYSSAANRTSDDSFTENDKHSVITWDGSNLHLLSNVATGGGAGTFSNLTGSAIANAIVYAGMTITDAETITVSVQDTDYTVTFENNVTGAGATPDATGDDDITITADCAALIVFNYQLTGTASKTYTVSISIDGTPVLSKATAVPATGTIEDSLVVVRTLTADEAITAEIQNDTDTEDAVFGDAQLMVFGIQDFS